MSKEERRLLRAIGEAQWEIQEYARAIRDLIAPIVPLAFAAWQKHCAPALCVDLGLHRDHD